MSEDIQVIPALDWSRITSNLSDWSSTRRVRTWINQAPERIAYEARPKVEDDVRPEHRVDEEREFVAAVRVERRVVLLRDAATTRNLSEARSLHHTQLQIPTFFFAFLE